MHVLIHLTFKHFQKTVLDWNTFGAVGCSFQPALIVFKNLVSKNLKLKLEEINLKGKCGGKEE